MREIKLINICDHMISQPRLMIKIDHMITLRTHTVQSSIWKFDIIHNFSQCLNVIVFSFSYSFTLALLLKN